MKAKSTKKALLCSLLSLVVCISMLVGSTFAWFTDSVTSANNKIVSGNLVLDLSVLEKDNTTWTSVKTSKAPIFNYTNWEPGYTEVKILKVSNLGSLALKWKATFKSAAPLGDLANVIDVYVMPGVTAYSADRTVLDGWTKVGTLKEFANTLSTTTYGQLTAKGTATAEATLGLAFKMQETAGNTYQNASLGAFDITILATQLNYESDSFDSSYDIGAEYDENNSTDAPVFYVGTVADLQAALSPTITNGDAVVELSKDIELAAGQTWTPLSLDSYTGVSRVIINGNGHTIKGLNDALLSSAIFGNTKVEINDLTLENSVVNSTTNYAGAFLSYADNSIAVNLKNCHVKNANVSSASYAGGLVGYVAAPITIEGCSVTGSTIISGGSAGALGGMISTAQGHETAVVSKATVTGNTVTSNKVGSYRVGELFGTTNIEYVNLSEISANGNTCSQPGSNSGDSGAVNTKWIGRSSSTVTGDTSAIVTP